MITLEATRIGNLRLRLVELPAPDAELAPSHYLISESMVYRGFVAIVAAGYSPVQARKAFTYYTERELARIAAERDDGQ